MADSEIELGIKVTGKGIDKATEQLEELAKAGEKAEKGSKGVGKGAKDSVAPLKNMRAQAQQASYQLQDIAVQAQMGTNGFTIFAQQGSQLASVFGPAGAVTGALIAFGGIVGRLLWDSFNKTGEAMKALEAEMKTLEENFDSLGEAGKAYVKTLVTKDIESYDAALEKLNKEKDRAQKFTTQGILATKVMLETDEEYLDSLEETGAEIERLTFLRQEAIKSIDGTSKKTEDLIKKLTEESDVMRLNSAELANYKIEQLKANDADAKTIRDKSRLIEEYRLEQEAIKETARLEKVTANEKKKADAAKVRADAKAKAEAKSAAERLAKDKEGAEARLLQIAQSAMDESALLDSILNENATKLAEDYANKLINEEQFLIGMKALNEKYSKDGVALDLATAQAKTDIQMQMLNGLGSLAGQLSSIAEKGSKEAKVLFAVQKGIAIATTIMNAHVAAGAVVLPPPVGLGPVAGLGFSKMILGMGYASAGIIAGTAIAGGRALGGQVRGGESYLVGERGPELLTMGSSGRIATNENLKKAVGSESGQSQANVSVNFSIQANDTAGFDRLLNSRRGQIVSMINHAVNNRGRASIT